MPQLHYAVGVDLGGTTIKTGVVSSAGKIIAQSRYPTFGEQGPKAVVAQIRKSIEEVLIKAKGKALRGIGIGAPGIVDEKGGIVKDPPNFADWHNVALGNAIAKMFKLNVKVENDANVAAIAEAKFGAGKQHPNFLFVIWGTGVGGGIILNGNIYRGPFGGAGEIGHVSIDYNGLQCNCGARGCVEAYIGQRHLSRRTVDRLKNYPGSAILKLAGGDPSKVEPKYISQAALKGDKLAREIFTEAGTLLGVALGSVLNTIDLRVIIIGGGISAAGDFVFHAIKKSVQAHVMKPMREDIIVLPAKLGNSAGILGAAGLVL
ncbi:MAG: ROK family protein [Bacteroidota bacterium]